MSGPASLTLCPYRRRNGWFAGSREQLREEESMKNINRRSALALGATVVAAPVVTWASPAAAKSYGPTEGTEISPGVRMVTLGTRDAKIKGYKSIVMEDYVFQPKGAIPLGEAMTDDMVCTTTEGELEVIAGDMKFTARKAMCGAAAKAARKRVPSTTEPWSRSCG